MPEQVVVRSSIWSGFHFKFATSFVQDVDQLFIIYRAFESTKGNKYVKRPFSLQVLLRLSKQLAHQ